MFLCLCVYVLWPPETGFKSIRRCTTETKTEKVSWLTRGKTSLKLRADATAQPRTLQLAQQLSTNTRSMTQWHVKARHSAAWQPAAIKYASAQRRSVDANSILPSHLHPACSDCIYVVSRSHTTNLRSLIYLPCPKCLLIACSLSSLSFSLPLAFFLASFSAWESIEDSQQWSCRLD